MPLRGRALSLIVDTKPNLLEVLKDRYNRGSTVITSQIMVQYWHQVIGTSTLADAILDTLVYKTPTN